jgi:hypothetical protein
MNRQPGVLGIVALLGMGSAVLLFAATFQLTPVTSSNIQQVTWPTGTVTPGVTSISWSLNPSNSVVYTGAGTLANESALQSVLGASFSLWSGAQYPPGTGSNVNTLAFSQVANNANATFNAADCVNSIGFTDSSLGTAVIALTVVTSFSAGGATGFTYSCTPGPTTRICPNEVCITDADIEFNTNGNFFTPGYSHPPAGYFDLQTVATHEIGHMIGLDHSGLANAMMYPYGDTGTGGIKYSLATDDKIGTVVLYGSAAMGSLFGGIKGWVTVGGAPAPGAHVVAIDATTGNVITDTLTDNNGTYLLRMFGGTYYVLALPLATDTSGDSGTNGVTSINNYHGWQAGYPTTTVQTQFTGKYY